MHKAVLLILILAITSISAALADVPKIKFDATFEVLTPFGKGELRQACDGNGHMLHASTAFNGNKDITIVDFVSKRRIVLVPREKTAIQTEIADDGLDLLYDLKSAKKPGAKSLGTKKIFGYSCHGWEAKMRDQVKQTWIGDSTNYLVYSESRLGNLKTIVSLKNWSNKAPARSEFDIPADYKKVLLNGKNNGGLRLDPDIVSINPLIQSGKFAEAVEELTRKLEKDPSKKNLLLVRGGILYRSLGKPELALKDFNSAIATDPSFFQAYKRRGEFYLYMNKHSEAKADFDQCLKLEPRYGDVWVFIAMLHAKEAKWNDALDDLAKAEKNTIIDKSLYNKLKPLCVEAAKKHASSK